MDIFRWTDEQIRWHMSRRAWPGEIVGKEADGVGVTVKRLGFSATEGPYPTERGAWGALRVGDRCLIRTEGPVPIVGMPLELTAPANQMQIVGEDYSVGETFEPSTWKPLLRVEDILIPGPGFVICHMTVEANRGSPGGSSEMQVRFLINDEPSSAYNVGPTGLFTGQDTTIPLWIGAYSAGFPGFEGRIFGFLSGTNISGVEVEDITSLALEGRTNDTVNGNDQLLATNMLVFA